MEKIYKVAVAGLTHGHIRGLLDNWKRHERADIVALAEPDAGLAKPVVEKYGIPTLYADWREMLAKEEFDILQVGTDNLSKTEIIVEAARHHKAVTAEKPLAVNLAAARQIRTAVEENDIVFLTNWWTGWERGRRTIQRLALEGAVGDIWQVKDRQGHAGPREIGCGDEFWTWLYDESKNGGGAGADFIGYGAVTAAYLLGRPELVWGTAGNLTKEYAISDDNAVFIARYPKAMVILEGTWSQQGGDGIGYPVVYGTKGILRHGGDKVVLENNDGRQSIELDPLPAVHDHASYLIHCIESGTKPDGLFSMENSFIAQEIIEAGYAAAKSGDAVRL